MALTAYTDADHAEADYNAMSGWYVNQIQCEDADSIIGYGFAYNHIPLYCDNKSAMALCCNNVKNAILQAHYEKLGIMQQFSIARTP
ncbi:hypothetical protein Tco_1053182 [Tanacetum coccineum]